MSKTAYEILSDRIAGIEAHFTEQITKLELRVEQLEKKPPVGVIRNGQKTSDGRNNPTQRPKAIHSLDE